MTDHIVLDLGTGSGVLSMAAALMGARSVVGIDVDQDAINSAETSAQLEHAARHHHLRGIRLPSRSAASRQTSCSPT